MDSAVLQSNEYDIDGIFEKFCVSKTTGFLIEHPAVKVSAAVEEIFGNSCVDYMHRLETIARNLPTIIRAQSVASTIQSLPAFNDYIFLRYLSHRQQYFLMQIFGMLTHAYFVETLGYTQASDVQKDASIKTLPKALAKPLWFLSKELEIAPSFSYSLYSLYNYSIPNPDEQISLDNIKLIHSFTGSFDEEWFVNIHQIIEKTAAPAIRALFHAAYVIAQTDLQKEVREIVIEDMETAVLPLEYALCVLKRMREHCDYRTYFDTVRKFYIFPKNVVFEGVEELGGKPLSFYGETGGQTPLMHSLLSLLGMYPSHIPYFSEMRQYMARPHRQFVEYTLGHWNIRAFVDLYSKRYQRLIQSYNALVQFVVDWRAEHLSLVRDYIKEYGDTHGTGSTPLEWLERLHQHAESFLISLSPLKSKK